MLYEIPLQTSAYYTITVDLDNETFNLVFRFNGRESAWYMDICQVDNSVIAGGIKVVPNIDLSGRFRAVGSPKGSLMALGESEMADKPGRDDLGTRVKLYYLDEAELLALEAA